MAALFEGVGIALSSLRSNKMRASLTILGVAIAVGVVIVISALIAGFNKGISDMLASLGPKTFWVGRYWGGQGDVDPEDPNPWRHRPPLTVAEADRLERLPTIAFVVYDEGTSANIEFEGRRLAAVQVRGRDADWPMIEGGRISPGRSYSHFEDAANAHVVVVNTKLAEQLFGQREALDRRIKIGGMPYQVIGVYDPPPRLFEAGDRPEVFVPHGTMIKDLPYFRGWMDMFVVPEDSVTVERASLKRTNRAGAMAAAAANPPVLTSSRTTTVRTLDRGMGAILSAMSMTVFRTRLGAHSGRGEEYVTVVRD